MKAANGSLNATAFVAQGPNAGLQICRGIPPLVTPLRVNIHSFEACPNIHAGTLEIGHRHGDLSAMARCVDDHDDRSSYQMHMYRQLVHGTRWGGIMTPRLQFSSSVLLKFIMIINGVIDISLSVWLKIINIMVSYQLISLSQGLHLGQSRIMRGWMDIHIYPHGSFVDPIERWRA